MIIKMIQNLRMEKIQETFNKDLEKLKSKQTMMNNKTNKIKNSLEGINSRITETEERISDLEEKIGEITTTEQNKEKRMKRIEDSLRDLRDNINIPTFELYRSQKKKRKGKGLRKYLKRL